MSILNAAGGLGLDNFKAGQFIMFTAMISLRVPILRLDQDKRLHIIWTGMWFPFFVKGSFLCQGRTHQ